MYISYSILSPSAPTMFAKLDTHKWAVAHTGLRDRQEETATHSNDGKL